MAGRKPLPQSYHERTGTYKINPERRPEGKEPNAPRGKPKRPPKLSGEYLKEWNRLTKLLDQMGVLCKTDQNGIEILACAIVDYRAAREKVAEYGQCLVGDDGSIKKNPYQQVLRDSATQVTKLLAEFGLTPSSRTRVRIMDKETDSGLDPLMAIIASRN